MDDTQPVECNEAGGRQSKLLNMFILLAPYAMRALTSILRKGGIKYNYENWRKIPTEDHVNHAMAHINNWLECEVYKRTAQEGSLIPARPAEDELAHAFCRLMFAVEMETMKYGLHPEHSAAAHEQIERKYLRRAEQAEPRVYRLGQVDTRERDTIPTGYPTKRPHP